MQGSKFYRAKIDAGDPVRQLWRKLAKQIGLDFRALQAHRCSALRKAGLRHLMLILVLFVFADASVGTQVRQLCP